MKCSKCGMVNQRRMKFCGECGATLPAAPPDVVCPACSFTNRPTSYFCANCGAKLEVATLSAVPALEHSCPHCGHANRGVAKLCANCGQRLPAPLDEHHDERRIVTVIFGDIAGFTTMSEQLDPEEVKEISRACFVKLNEEVARYDGHVDKYLGDNIMVLFGAPVAHEDDPERAVRCALEMQRAIHELGDGFEREMAAKHGLHFALELHIGINTGEVMAGLMGSNREQDYTVMGDAVNLASRLQHAADPGKILVGEATYRATGQAVEYREIEPLRVRGKAQPVPVWEVVGLRAQRDRLLDAAGLEAPFIGRAAPFAKLKSLYERVANRRQPDIVLIHGDVGIGKSRFLLEFEKFAEGLPQAVSFRKGRCLPYSEAAYTDALAEVVRRECNIRDDDAAEVKFAKLNNRVRQLYVNDNPSPADARLHEREVRETIQLLADLLSLSTTDSLERMDTQSRRDNLFLALRRFFERCAAAAPYVLAFEDVHWDNEEGLLDFSNYLITTATAPILILCLARPQLLEQHPRWTAKTGAANPIKLNRLSDADSGLLLDELLKGANVVAIPAPLRDKIIATAEGNPFYLEETVRILHAQGVLHRDGDTSDLDSVRIPDTIQGLVGARIDRLGLRPDGKEDPEGRLQKLVLQAAAAVGRRFWQGAIVALLGNAAEVETALAGLQAEGKEFIYENRSGSRFTGEREYSFRSSLTRDVAYNTLPKLRRRDWHAQIARWIEAKVAPLGKRGAEYVELLAYHYEEAARLELEVLDLVSSEEPTDRERNTLKAVQFLQAQGDRERARQNIKAAASLYRRAIDRAEARNIQPPTYPQLLCAYATVLEVLGQYDEALRYLEAVQQPATHPSESDLACALTQQADVYQRQGRLVEAEQLAITALTKYGQLDDKPGIAEALRVLGRVAISADQMGKGQEYFQRLYQLCVALDDRAGQARALYQLSEVCFYRNEPKQCIYLAQEAQAIFNTIGDKRQVAYCMRQLAAVYTDLAEYNRAASYERQANTLFTSLGDRSGVARTLSGLARIYYQQGHHEDAITTSQQALAIGREIGSSLIIVWAMRWLGQTYFALGHLDAATQTYREALQLAADILLLTVQPELCRGLAEVAITQKQAQAALNYIAQGMEGLSSDDYYSHATLLRVRGQAYNLADDPRAAADLQQSIAILKQHEYPAELAVAYRAYADYLATHDHATEAADYRTRAEAVTLEANIRDSSESLTQMLSTVRP